MIRAKSVIVIFTLFLFFGCAAADVKGRSSRSVRVLILSGVKEVNIAGARKKGDGIIRADKGGINFNGKPVDAPLILYPKDDFLYVNGKSYRGSVEVRADKGGVLVINELPLEVYLVGIINSEISSKWHPEVVKAQSVIARTYTLYQKEKRKGSLYDLTATFMDQLYSGAASEDTASMDAVKKTRGEALTYEGRPALTVYHSNAGGITEDSENVWQSEYAYLKKVKSSYDESAPNFSWELSLSNALVAEKLKNGGYDISRVASLSVKARSDSGRVNVLTIKTIGSDDIEISGEEFRKLIGYSTLKSAIFDVEDKGDGFIFRGRGSGHGVGMSQWGAKGMAEDGYTYKEILKHYYPGTVLKKLY